jgi:hypothetical protein
VGGTSAGRALPQALLPADRVQVGSQQLLLLLLVCMRFKLKGTSAVAVTHIHEEVASKALHLHACTCSLLPTVPQRSLI